MSGQKIIDALHEIAHGDIECITIHGKTFMRADWRPIETAPKMRTILLFAITDTETGNWRMETGCWLEGRDVWEWGGRVLATYETQPTHWMPLPEAPRS